MPLGACLSLLKPLPTWASLPSFLPFREVAWEELERPMLAWGAGVLATL